MDLALRADLIPPELPFGVIGSLGIDPESKRLAFSLQTPGQPYDVWVFGLGNSELVRWTQSELGPLDASRLVAPQLVQYPRSTRSTESRARFRPGFTSPRAHGPHPVLISIHGGPESQSQPIFSIAAQQWAVELAMP